jgi:hypothetical protein
MATIRHLLFAPSIAVARLGASTTPMDAFAWGPGDPHIAETRIKPDWTLDVDAIGNVTARLPCALVLRDGLWHRPVAPFLELWALVGDGGRNQWRAAPVTRELLAANHLKPRDITFTVTAMNRKAARRAGLPPLRFGTFPPVVLTGDDHTPVPLLGTSPPGVANPMIPAGRYIPLGGVQVLRPQSQPEKHPFPDTLRLDVVRLRFTPASGWCYGPPAASQTSPPAVIPERAFLNPDAGWFDAPRSRSIIDPIDTVDEQDRLPPQPTNVGIRRPIPNRSLGVVDDTCDAVITASLHANKTKFVAHANIAVAPPHFAPDRRPFLSLADEINDRQPDPARDHNLSSQDLGLWVQDLFERIFETVSLFGVDFYRDRFAAELKGEALADNKIGDDGVPKSDHAMGGRDVLRDRDIAIAAPSKDEPFPLAARAREQHRALADLNQLRSWVQTHPDRLAELVREPFTVWPGENPETMTMRMPPFMRNSNAYPLTLARWQYDLLMKWKRAVIAGDTDAFAAATALGPSAVQDQASLGLSSTAARRRREILDLLPEEHQ